MVRSLLCCFHCHVQKWGFEYQTEETIDLSKYGSTGMATVVLLTREPQPVDLFAQGKASQQRTFCGTFMDGNQAIL